VLSEHSLPEADSSHEILTKYSRSGLNFRTSQRKIGSSQQYSVSWRNNYVKGVGQKFGPCTATFNDLLCFGETIDWITLVSLNDVFSTTYVTYIASNYGMIVNDILEEMLKEVVVACFKVLSQRTPGLSITSGNLIQYDWPVR
jgi:hypothetical protein